jgi:outer membrane protein TolC
MRRCFNVVFLIVFLFALGWKGFPVLPAAAQEDAESEEITGDDDSWESLPSDDKEAAQKEAAQKEAAQKEAAQKEAAQKEAAQKEAAQKEAAQKEAAQKEAAQKEAAQKEAAQEEAALEESPKASVQKEAAQKEAAQKEAVQKEAVQKEAAKKEAVQKEIASEEAQDEMIPEDEPAQAVPAEKAAPSLPVVPSAPVAKTVSSEKQANEEELMLEPDLEETFKEENGGAKPATPEVKKEGSGAEESASDEAVENEGWEEANPEEENKNIEKAEAEQEAAQKIPNVLTNLDECKRVALLNDRRVQVALREIHFQRCKIAEAERNFLPQVKGTWQSQTGASDQGAGKADADFQGLKYALEGNQILFNGGKLTYTLKQEKTKLAVAKRKFEQARQETINKVEKAYYELVKAQMIFQIQTDLSKAAEAALSFSREAYRQGLNPYQDFLNVQSQTDQTYYQLLSSQQDIALAELELRNVCNVDASVGVQINAVLTFTDFDFNYSLDECMVLGFKNRPDLSVNELTMLSDLYGIRLAIADTMPKIEMNGHVGKNGQTQTNQPGQVMQLGDEWEVKVMATWAVGANSLEYDYDKKKTVPVKFGATDNVKDALTQDLSLALFDKLEKLSDVAKSQVTKMTSEADLMELRAKVAKEVDENYFNYQKAMTSVTASLSKIKFREKDLEINRAKQMMNDEPLSQVLQAELQLGEERVNYVKALADYYESISGLFKAMGLSK